MKLWSMFVEPPWSYQVRGGEIRLDVMGTLTKFNLAAGPTARHETLLSVDDAMRTIEQALPPARSYSASRGSGRRPT